MRYLQYDPDTGIVPEDFSKKSAAPKLRESVRKLPNSKTCFVCGDSNPSGLKVRFWVDGDSVLTRFTPGIEQMGYHGVTHGGVIAALLDETMGWAPSLEQRRFCVSIELNVQYLKPIPIGTEITVTGKSKSANRRIWEAAGEITDSDGTVYARGTGRFVAISDEQTRDVVTYLQFDEETVPPDQICRLTD